MKTNSDGRPSQRREPRGIDEQWAAAEVERWRSVDIPASDPLADDAITQRRPLENSRRSKERAPLSWVTVIVAALTVGGLLLYLLITFSQMGPPKELPRQPDVRTKSAPVDGGRQMSRNRQERQADAR